MKLWCGRAACMLHGPGAPGQGREQQEASLARPGSRTARGVAGCCDDAVRGWAESDRPELCDGFAAPRFGWKWGGRPVRLPG